MRAEVRPRWWQWWDVLAILLLLGPIVGMSLAGVIAVTFLPAGRPTIVSAVIFGVIVVLTALAMAAMMARSKLAHSYLTLTSTAIEVGRTSARFRVELADVERVMVGLPPLSRRAGRLLVAGSVLGATQHASGISATYHKRRSRMLVARLRDGRIVVLEPFRENTGGGAEFVDTLCKLLTGRIAAGHDEYLPEEIERLSHFRPPHVNQKPWS